MLRPRFRRVPERRFRVDLTVHRLDHIPHIHRHLYVFWRCKRSEPYEGRTTSSPVQPGNFVNWDEKSQFLVTILSDPTDPTILQESRLELELRSEKRARWVGTTSYQVEGKVTIDLSEVAAVLSLSRNFLVHQTKLNITLKLSLRVTHESGDKIFRTRTLPNFQNGATLPYRGTPASTTPPSVSNSDTPQQQSLNTIDDDTSSSRDTSYRNSRSILPSSEHPMFADRTISNDRFIHNTAIPPLPSYPSSNSSSPAPNQTPWSTPNVNVSSYQSKISNSSPSLAIPEYFSSIEAPELNNPDPYFNQIESPLSILQRIIPNPDISQRTIYEKIYQDRIRDEWPQDIIDSRVNGIQVVNDVYAAVCQADGIGISTTSKTKETKPTVEIAKHNLDVDFLLESRDASTDSPEAAGPVTQMLLTRRPSARSPHLSVRSSSMSEIAELARRGL